MRTLLALLLLAASAPAAVQTYVGSFAANTSTGNQAITGVGFTPKLILFFYTGGLTADGSAANAFLGFGVVTGAAEDNGGSATAVNGLSTSASNAIPNNSKAIRVGALTGATSVVAEADILTLGVDGFTLDWTTVDGVARVVNYIAIGGDIVSRRNNFTTAGATGDQVVTIGGSAFGTPELVIMWYFAQTTPQANFNFSFGAATSPTDSWTVTTSSQSGVGTTLAKHYQRTGKLMAGLFPTLGTLAIEGALTSFGSGEFTVNWSTAVGGADFNYIVVRADGGTANFKAGTFNQATATGAQAVSGVGFRPAALLLAGTGGVTSASINDHNRVSFGAAASGTARWTQALGDENGVTTTDASSYLQRDQVYAAITENGASPAVNAEADFSSFAADGFNLNWGTADATAREMLYLAFGPGTGGAGGIRHRVTQE